jgi:hypothetical protein
MTQRFLSAAFSRRSAPKQYDPAWLTVELSRIQQAMPTFIMRKLTSAGILQPNDGLVLCDATTGSFTLTLGDPAKGSGRPVTIKKSDASGNAILLGGTIDGVTNRTLAAQNDSVVIQSDGTAWFRPMLTGTGSDFSGQEIIGASLTVDTSTATADDLVVDGKAFGTANWTTNNLTVTSNSTTAPDGTTTADTLTGTGADALVVQTLATTAASRYTVSVDLKWGNTARSQFGLYDVTGGAWVLRIEATWTAGAVSALATAQGAGGDYVITSLGSGWYRCTGTTTNAFVLGRTHSVSIYPVAVTVGAAGSYVYAWNMRVYPRINAITATGPVSITGPTAITGTLSVSGVATLTSQPICSSLTASQAVFTDASKGLVSVATTGTGSVVLAASPTITGTANIAGITYTTALGSLTPYATPAAFTQTLSSQFASTVSGATLMGYGTTGDVTLKNRAGTDALYVAANTTNVVIAGCVAVKGATLSTSTALIVPASTTAVSSLRIPSGTAPTSPISGDLWYDGTNLVFRDGSTTRLLQWV